MEPPLRPLQSSSNVTEILGSYIIYTKRYVVDVQYFPKGSFGRQ